MQFLQLKRNPIFIWWRFSWYPTCIYCFANLHLTDSQWSHKWPFLPAWSLCPKLKGVVTIGHKKYTTKRSLIYSLSLFLSVSLNQSKTMSSVNGSSFDIKIIAGSRSFVMSHNIGWKSFVGCVFAILLYIDNRFYKLYYQIILIIWNDSNKLTLEFRFRSSIIFIFHTSYAITLNN